MRIIAGEARGRKIAAPSGTNTRPTLDRVRENLFNMIQSRISGCHVLDLFAGSGALGFEALSRGAASAVLVDHERNANSVQRANSSLLGFQDRTRIILSDWAEALRILRNEGRKFDIVFLDPPYSCSFLPGVFASLVPLIDPDSLIILEHEGKCRPDPPAGYACVRQRAWGYCGISIYRLLTPDDEKGEEQP